ncbi:hypothetical protein [Natronobacterium gregoryi]|nr:hypothetical protein [Natronobacterium gregoryi]
MVDDVDWAECEAADGGADELSGRESERSAIVGTMRVDMTTTRPATPIARHVASISFPIGDCAIGLIPITPRTNSTTPTPRLPNREKVTKRRKTAAKSISTSPFVGGRSGNTARETSERIQELFYRSA